MIKRSILLIYFFVQVFILSSSQASRVDLQELFEKQKNEAARYAVVYLEDMMNSRQPESWILKGTQQEVNLILILYLNSAPKRHFTPTAILDAKRLFEMIAENNDLSAEHFSPLDIDVMRGICLNKHISRYQIAWWQIYTNIFR